MIAIVDYGVGNIKNIERAIHHLGFEAVLTDNPEVIRSSSHIVLPGVGHFKDAMQALRQSGLDKVLDRIAKFQTVYRDMFRNAAYVRPQC